MTNIKIYKKSGLIASIECIGHTGYSESGTDIVCASISTIMQMTLLGIKKVIKGKVNCQINEDAGYMLIDILDFENDAVQVLCNTAYFSIKELQKEYRDYILLEVIDNV